MNQKDLESLAKVYRGDLEDIYMSHESGNDFVFRAIAMLKHRINEL